MVINKRQDLKILLLGSRGVGKSRITLQYLHHIFTDEYDPTIEEAYRRTYLKMDDSYAPAVELVDLYGAFHDTDTNMTSIAVKAADGFIFVYSITDRSSFASVASLLDQVWHLKGTDSVPALLLGNKMDLDDIREVGADEGRALAKELKIDFLECTAKQDVDHIVKRMVKIVLEHDQRQQQENERDPSRKRIEERRCSFM